MKKLYTLLLAISPFLSFAQVLNPLVDSIPMRDSEKLAADIYLSSNCSQCPTILIQTPYNRLLARLGLPMGIGQDLSDLQYNFVVVDWRGFYGSSGALNGTPNRGEDGYDVVEWIAAQSWSDGQVATWGPSALGKVQFQTAKEQPPHLVCGVPLVAGSQFDYDEYYPGGALRTEYVEQLDGLGFGVSGVILANQVSNITWQFVENQNYYPDQIQVPMFMIGGWYDHNVEVMMELFSGLQSQSPQNVRDKHKIMMGPWAHGGFGSAQVGTCTQGELTYTEACGWSDSLAWDFLNYYLLGEQNGWDNNQAVLYFQMGENNWYQADAWPVQTTGQVKFYLTENETLSNELPTQNNSSSSLVYDPRDPSPTIGGSTLRQDLFQGPADQAPEVESRNDILTFTTGAFFDDAVMKGKPKVHLFVSSDRIDTDFVIRLTDVYPDGRSMLLNENIQRMRFRDGYTVNDTSSMIPGQVYEIDVELPNIANTFIVGHKLRIDITSSNYPRFDANLNDGGAMYVAGDTLVATNTVYHQVGQASYIELPLENYTGVEEAKETSFAVYPNPADEYFILELPANSGEATISITDVTGRNVYLSQNFGKRLLQIDTKKFVPGPYFIQVVTRQERTTEPLVIRR